jgi:hypothetical protein
MKGRLYMSALRDSEEPNAREAEENLRTIRELMERSTRFSTFSGLSGVTAGAASIAGCVATQSLTQKQPAPSEFRLDFIVIWSLVIITAIGMDYLLTKRKAALVGKRIISRLGKQMVIGAGPGLGTGALLTLFLLQHNIVSEIYPMWMLCYGCAVCAVGLFSQREVLYLGAAFLTAGAVTLTLIPSWGLPMMAVTFGGFHVGYGLAMSRRDGW